jgi:hypothetical protein
MEQILRQTLHCLITIILAANTDYILKPYRDIRFDRDQRTATAVAESACGRSQSFCGG